MSMDKVRQLREKRTGLITQARAILDKAEQEKRDMSQEEQNTWDTLMDDADKLHVQIEREERQLQAEGQLAASQHNPIHVQTIDQVNDLRQNPSILAGQVPNIIESQVIDPALHRYFNINQNAEDQRARLRRLHTFRLFLPRWIAGDWNRGLGGDEMRALQAELDVGGGYLRPPEEFINQLIQNIDDVTYIRQWATTFTVTGPESLGVPTLEADPADSDWTSELATGSEDSSMSFGKRNLHPHPLAKRIKISKKLLRAVPNAEEIVRNRLSYKFGITFEKACLTGNGAQQPLGVFVASADGISTNRDVSTGNTQTAIQPDGLKEAKYALKQQYWPMARWLFHRDAAKQISKMKDGEGRYYWQDSIQVGEPDRLLNFPVAMSEYAPNTFTASQYVGIVGDFSNYWIADALTLEFQMLMELYAETNQVGLIGRLESDGQPVLEEAFARVQLAS